MNIRQLKTFSTKPLTDWNFQDVGTWLDRIYLNEYKDIFIQSKIDGDMLVLLTEDDVKQGLQITNFMHRKRLMAALEKFRELYSTQADELKSKSI